MVRFEVMTPVHHRRVAAIHAECMAGGFLPSLGRPFLVALYDAMLASHAARGVVALDGDEVVGFACYTADSPMLFRRTLGHGGARLAWPAALGFLRRPWLLLRFVETLRYGAAARVPGVDAEIVTWAVAPGHRRQHVGTRIVDALEVLMRADGVRAYKYSVYEEHRAAIDYYHQRGDVCVGSFQLYGRTWFVFRCDLAARSADG